MPPEAGTSGGMRRPIARGDCRVRNRLALVFQVASLALTGWVLWGARLAPHLNRISLFDLVTRAAAYALAAGAAGAAITLVLFLGAREWEREDIFRATLRTSRSAVWFAPAVILFTALSPAATAAAAVLVVSATRLLYPRVAHDASRHRRLHRRKYCLRRSQFPPPPTGGRPRPD